MIFLQPLPHRLNNHTRRLIGVDEGEGIPTRFRARLQQRHSAENFAEEQLAIFDLLTRPSIELSARDRDQVKRVARDLLATLKHEKLVLDWKKRQSARVAVQVAIRDVLDKELPIIALFASNPFTLPVAFGVGLMFAEVVGLFKLLPYLSDEFAKQKRILGY